MGLCGACVRPALCSIFYARPINYVKARSGPARQWATAALCGFVSRVFQTQLQQQATANSAAHYKQAAQRHQSMVSMVSPMVSIIEWYQVDVLIPALMCLALTWPVPHAISNNYDHHATMTTGCQGWARCAPVRPMPRT